MKDEGVEILSISVMKDLLLSEFYIAVRTTKSLLSKVAEEQFNYRPNENMRSLLELANHLVQIPAVDVAIAQEANEEEIRQLEKKLYSQDVKVLAEVMEKGFENFKAYFESLSEDEFLNKVTKPFYFSEEMQGHTQAKWLVESTTHAFHHRGQFFNYLKELGLDVNMFDLY